MPVDASCGPLPAAHRPPSSSYFVLRTSSYFVLRASYFVLLTTCAIAATKLARTQHAGRVLLRASCFVLDQLRDQMGQRRRYWPPDWPPVAHWVLGPVRSWVGLGVARGAQLGPWAAGFGGQWPLRAVRSSPFPPCATRRRGGPGGGWGPPGLAPGPRPPRPHLDFASWSCACRAVS
jgi:hypothetical protein